MGELTALVLAGDVMTGRGVDQVLPHPGAPELRETYVDDARTYVRLAERVSGAVPQPVDPRWPWGETLEVMDAEPGAVRLMNLETSITRSETRAPGKAVHYRMSPDNLDVLRVARADVWTLANNHVLDHGLEGLADTLNLLRGAGLRVTGAGATAEEAWRPAVVPVSGGRRVVVLSVAHASSGVPSAWRAGPGSPGVALLPDLSERTAENVAARLAEDAEPGDIRVVSVHWGSNWGYDIPAEQRRFGHLLVEAGVHLVHGHSSHHPRPVEVYRGHLVLHGCGDLVNDYEGISGHEEFRDNLRLLHLVELEPVTGRLVTLRMVPFVARRLRLERAGAADARWLAAALDRAGRLLGARVETDPSGLLRVPLG